MIRDNVGAVVDLDARGRARRRSACPTASSGRARRRTPASASSAASRILGTTGVVRPVLHRVLARVGRAGRRRHGRAGASRRWCSPPAAAPRRPPCGCCPTCPRSASSRSATSPAPRCARPSSDGLRDVVFVGMAGKLTKLAERRPHDALHAQPGSTSTCSPRSTPRGRCARRSRGGATPPGTRTSCGRPPACCGPAGDLLCARVAEVLTRFGGLPARVAMVDPDGRARRRRDGAGVGGARDHRRRLRRRPADPHVRAARWRAAVARHGRPPPPARGRPARRAPDGWRCATTRAAPCRPSSTSRRRRSSSWPPATRASSASCALLRERVRRGRLEVLPGVSSRRAGVRPRRLSWDDAVVVSAHGRDPGRRRRRGAAVARPRSPCSPTARCGPAELGAALPAAPTGVLVVAERLGLPDERVVDLDPAEPAAAVGASPTSCSSLDEARAVAAEHGLARRPRAAGRLGAARDGVRAPRRR